MVRGLLGWAGEPLSDLERIEARGRSPTSWVATSSPSPGTSSGPTSSRPRGTVLLRQLLADLHPAPARPAVRPGPGSHRAAVQLRPRHLHCAATRNCWWVTGRDPPVGHQERLSRGVRHLPVGGAPDHVAALRQALDLGCPRRHCAEHAPAEVRSWLGQVLTHRTAPRSGSSRRAATCRTWRLLLDAPFLRSPDPLGPGPSAVPTSTPSSYCNPEHLQGTTTGGRWTGSVQRSPCAEQVAASTIGSFGVSSNVLATPAVPLRQHTVDDYARREESRRPALPSCSSPTTSWDSRAPERVPRPVSGPRRDHRRQPAAQPAHPRRADADRGPARGSTGLHRASREPTRWHVACRSGLAGAALGRGRQPGRPWTTSRAWWTARRETGGRRVPAHGARPDRRETARAPARRPAPAPGSSSAPPASATPRRRGRAAGDPPRLPDLPPRPGPRPRRFRRVADVDQLAALFGDPERAVTSRPSPQQGPSGHTPAEDPHF